MSAEGAREAEVAADYDRVASSVKVAAFAKALGRRKLREAGPDARALMHRSGKGPGDTPTSMARMGVRGMMDRREFLRKAAGASSTFSRLPARRSLSWRPGRGRPGCCRATGRSAPTVVRRPGLGSSSSTSIGFVHLRQSSAGRADHLLQPASGRTADRGDRRLHAQHPRHGLLGGGNTRPVPPDPAGRDRIDRLPAGGVARVNRGQLTSSGRYF